MDKIKQFFDQFNYIDYCSIVIYIISTVVIGYFMGSNLYIIAIITTVLVPFMFLLTLMFKSSFQYVNYHTVIDNLYKHKLIYKIQGFKLNNKLYYMAILSGKTRYGEKFEYVILNYEGKECLSWLYPDKPRKVKKDLLESATIEDINEYLSDTEADARKRIEICKQFVKDQKEKAENLVVNTITETNETIIK